MAPGRSLGSLLTLLATIGCATAKPPAAVDLDPARQALEAARQAGAPEQASDTFARAEDRLKQAEALAASMTDAAAACRAQGLTQQAEAEARCAEALAVERSRPSPPPVADTASTAELQRLQTVVRKSEEDERRLEEWVAMLQRDLAVTETEVIRTKARLKGTETKAEASSAVAEARILLRRLTNDKARAASLARGQELIDRAEQLLGEENYGAAAFFAMKAQDVATKGPGDGIEPIAERPPPQRSFVVKVGVANVRRGPGTAEPVIGTVPQGRVLTAIGVRGDWVHVGFGSGDGWVSRELLE